MSGIDFPHVSEMLLSLRTVVSENSFKTGRLGREIPRYRLYHIVLQTFKD